MNTEQIMKKCQIGFGNYAGALDDANNLLAECYGHIGKLDRALKELISIVEIHSRATGSNFAWAEIDAAREALNS